MILLESGPAKTDRNYWLIVAVVFLAFGGWFLKDGLYGYPAQNRQKAESDVLLSASLPANPAERAQMLKKLLGPKPTEKDFSQLRTKSSITRQDVHVALGQPLPPPLGAPREQTEFFVSLYGMASVPIDAQGRVDAQNMQWRSWGKSPEEIQAQFYWAIIPAVGALYFLYRFYKAATLRAMIDEEGMTFGGVRIPFGDMVSLRDYSRKGWVDLYYKVGQGEQKLRIDNQKIAKFDEIIALLCQQTGFPDPRIAQDTEAEHEETGVEQEKAAEESPGEHT